MSVARVPTAWPVWPATKALLSWPMSGSIWRIASARAPGLASIDAKPSAPGNPARPSGSSRPSRSPGDSDPSWSTWRRRAVVMAPLIPPATGWTSSSHWLIVASTHSARLRARADPVGAPIVVIGSSQSWATATASATARRAGSGTTGSGPAAAAAARAASRAVWAGVGRVAGLRKVRSEAPIAAMTVGSLGSTPMPRKVAATCGSAAPPRSIRSIIAARSAGWFGSPAPGEVGSMGGSCMTVGPPVQPPGVRNRSVPTVCRPAVSGVRRCWAGPASGVSGITSCAGAGPHDRAPATQGRRPDHGLPRHTGARHTGGGHFCIRRSVGHNAA